MTSFGTDVDTALAGRVVTIAGAMEIVLPSHNLRLIDGAGIVTFPDDRVFTGRDATFGTLASIEPIEDGAGDQAPSLRVSLYPASDAAAVDLASADMQGAAVTFWIVVIDPDSGEVIGDPEEIYVGQVDVPTLRSGANERILEYQIVSVFEEFFSINDAVRLTDSFHQTIWPGEKGLAFVTSVKRQIYWGSSSPSDGVDIDKGLHRFFGNGIS